MIAAVLVLASAAGTFAPVLDAGFVFDDRADAIDNPAATPGGFVASIGVTNRPLLKASYALQRAATGDAPAPFHAVNLALHLAAAALVFALVRRAAAGVPPARRDLVAWAAAAVWALHPAAVESVAPVTGRSVLLSTVLLLAAFLLATGERPVRGPRALAIAGLALAAPLVRETALVLPGLLLLWQATLGAAEGRRRALGRQLPALAGAALAAVAIGLSERHRELIAFSVGRRSPIDALRGNLAALFDILGLWIAPGRISVDPPPAADPAWSEPAALARIVVLGLAAGAVVGLRRRRPRAAFAIGWTLLALAPANSILWRLDPVSPRALYLASVGLVLGLAGLASATAVAARGAGGPVVARLRPLGAGAAALLLAAALGGLARGARHRAALWADPPALWADAALKSPASPRPWLNLGVALMAEDRLEAAEAALGAVLALDPGEARARCALDSIRIRRLARAAPNARSPEPRSPT